MLTRLIGLLKCFRVYNYKVLYKYCILLLYIVIYVNHDTSIRMNTSILNSAAHQNIDSKLNWIPHIT